MNTKRIFPVGVIIITMERNWLHTRQMKLEKAVTASFIFEKIEFKDFNEMYVFLPQKSRISNNGHIQFAKMTYKEYDAWCL